MTSAAAAPRADGRASNEQVRQLSSEMGVLHRADGSARLSHGDSTVMVSVFGPVNVSQRNERIDEATIEVTFMPITGRITPVHVQYAELIRGVLESTIVKHDFPRSRIAITVQVIHDDGGLLAVALNAVTIALLDAGVPCNGMIGAITMMVMNQHNTNTFLLDPTLKEEQQYQQTVITVACNSGGGGGGGKADDDDDDDKNGVVLIHCIGSLEETNVMNCIHVAQTAIRHIHGYMKLSVTQSFNA